jgi:predicted regulator of Ras-like GTPase activity (Roadblock/LC7/MglB family)
MTEPLLRTLKSLRDVDGIIGSFVVGHDGQLLARDLPQYFDSSVLEEVGPRIHRLYDAWLTAGEELDAATLVFAEHKMHLRDLDGSVLAVVSGLAVNAPALKMALSLVGRKLSSEISSLPPPAPEPVTPSLPPVVAQPAPPVAGASLAPQASQPPTAASVAPDPAASQRPSQRFYRGQPI